MSFPAADRSVRAGILPRTLPGDDDTTAHWEYTESVGTISNRIHKPQAEMQGCGSFVKEGEALKPLPPFEGEPGPLYRDFLPESRPSTGS
jgi:hypothetical protein